MARLARDARQAALAVTEIVYSAITVHGASWQVKVDEIAEKIKLN